VTVSGTCETGATVQISVDDASNSVTPAVTTSATCAGAAYSKSVSVASLINGVLTATVTQTDAAGNTSSGGTATTTKNVSTTGTGAAKITVTVSGGSTYGSVITFKATVASRVRRGAVPTGTVTFNDGATTLGSAPVVRGIAKFPISSLAVGTHSITAVYEGSTAYAPVTSSPLNRTVRPVSTSTRVTSSDATSTVGQPVTFTATVRATTGGALGGTVAFKEGSSILAVVPVSNGSAGCIISSLPNGTHVITATYSGDPNHSTSSGRVIQRVR